MEKISPIKENILYFLEKQGITKTDFCEKTGISYANIKGKGLYSEIGGTQIGKILSSYSNLSPEWLLTGNGQMLKSDVQKTLVHASDASSESIDSQDKYNNNFRIVKIDEPTKYTEKIIESQKIPLYDVSAAAGYGSFDDMISQEKVVGEYVVPDFRSIDWMIYVKGSSMYPKYSSGDIIACRVLHESKFIQWGKVYVIVTREQGILVKRLKRSDNSDCILAVSDNTTYDPFDIPKDEVLGIALVVGVIRLE